MDSKETIIRWVDDHRTELVELLMELVAARTENPPGNEAAAAEVLARFFTRHGIPFETFEELPGRTNIIGRVGRGRPALLLPGHLDTVPAGDGWSMDPFRPEVRNGRLYGRGSCDDKGPTAAVALAGACLHACFRLRGSVLVAGVADEELGSACGLEYLLRERKVQADYAIVPDVAGNMKAIDVAEKGLAFVEIVSHGKQAHGSTPEKGVNAIWNLIAALNKLRTRGMPAATHALLTPPTYNLGQISGGAAPNIVPARASAVVDLRFLPGQSIEQVQALLEALLRETERETPGARFDLLVKTTHPATEVPLDNPLVRAIQETAQELIGVTPTLFGISGATVAKQLIAHGITAVGYSAGEGDVAHMADESINLDELVAFAKVTALTSVRLLGMESA